MPESYAGRRVLMTGGLGFLGCNLARQLVHEGATVTIVDLPDIVRQREFVDTSEGVSFVACDVRDSARLSHLLPDHDIMFWLAAHGGHLASMLEPLWDFDVNCRSIVGMLEACRTRHPRLPIVFTSTRQVYGRANRLPVDEQHPTRPPDVNGINKLAAEHYLRLYAEVYGQPTISLRLTNTYGPHMALDDPEKGVIGVLIGRALRGEPLVLYDGNQVRNFTYVDDVVNALLLAGRHADSSGSSFNLGAENAHSLRDFADILGRILPIEVQCAPFPVERQSIDVGSLTCDSSRFQRATGWQPVTDLETGVRQTVHHFQTKSSRSRNRLVRLQRD